MKHLAEANIIAVDNSIDDLKNLVCDLSFSGFPCVPVIYDPLKANPLEAVPAFPNARLVFMDLNFGPADTLAEPQNLAATIAEILTKINPLGAYVLIIWSTWDDGRAREAETFLRQAERFPELPGYMDFKFVRKTDMTDGQAGRGSIGRANEEVRAILDEMPIANALLLWQHRLSGVASQMVGDLIKLTNSGIFPAPQNDANPSIKLSMILSSLIKAFREGNGEIPSYKAIENSFIPVLSDCMFRSEFAEEESLAAWEEALSPARCTPMVELELPAEVKCQINRWLHVEIGDIPSTIRGSFSKTTLDSFQAVIGLSLDNFVSQNICFKNMQTRGAGDRTFPLKEIFLSCAVAGLLEISAKCDCAHTNPRLHRFLTAFLIPNEIVSCINSGNQKDLVPPAILTLKENFFLSGVNPSIPEGQYQLVVFLNFATGLTKERIEALLPSGGCLRLRENLTDYIAQFHSARSSRPGIIGFR